MFRFVLATLVLLAWIGTPPASWFAATSLGEATVEAESVALGASNELTEVNLEVVAEVETEDGSKDAAPHDGQASQQSEMGCWLGALGDPSLVVGGSTSATQRRRTGQGACRAPPVG